MIRCGSCRKTHQTVQQVRECYGNPLRLQLEPATDGQLRFLSTLFLERGMEDLTGVSDPETRKEFTKASASEWISDMVSKKREKGYQKLVSDVPAGYYATRGDDGKESADGDPEGYGEPPLDFWCVQRPEEGNWAGMVFVKRVLGGHDLITLPRKMQRMALERIGQEGHEEAGKLFGVSLGRCYACGTSLTDALSRELGIGPDCRKKWNAR
jgi:hypothetical protein